MARSSFGFGRVVTCAALASVAGTVVACANLLDIPDDRYVVFADGGSETDDDGGRPEGAAPTPTDCKGGIEVRILYDGTGATSGVSVPYYYGELDYLRELNEGGGISGCPVRYEALDYAYDINRAQAIYDGWKASPSWNKIVAVFGFGSGDTLQLAPLAKADKKPLISASYFGGLASPIPIDINVPVPEMNGTTPFSESSFPTHLTSDGFPYNFFAGTDYSTGIRIAMFHVKTSGGKRVGFFHCDQAYCTGPIPAGRTYAKAQGLSLGRDLVVQLTDDQATYDKKVHDYFVQELANASADPTYGAPVDWIWMGNTSKTTAYLAQAIDNLKTRKRPPSPDDSLAVQTALAGLNLNVIVNNWGFDEMLFPSCGPMDATNGCVERVHGIMPFTAYGDVSRGSSEMPKVVALHDKWRARDARSSDGGTGDGATIGVPPDGGSLTTPSYANVRYVQGYVSAMMFKVAVERVIASGKELTGPNVKEAFETFKQVDTGGLSDKLSFGPNDHRPQSTETLYKFNAAGKLVPEPPSRTISLDDKWLGW